MRFACAGFFAALAAGCYVPSPASGAFGCSGDDSACPDGQHCTCGLCVKSDADAVCSMTVQVDTTPLNQEADCPRPVGSAGNPEADTLCVYEHQPFAVTVHAFSDRAAQVPSKYTGLPSFDASWGSAKRSGDATPSGGTTVIMLTLDRATPAFKVYLTARVGDARGAASTGLVVDPPKYTVAPSADLAAPFGFATGDVGYPALDVSPTDGTRTMYFTGVTATDGAAIGAAAWDPGSMQWIPPATPLFAPPANTSYLSPSVLRPGDGSTLVLFDSAVGSMPTDLVVATRGADGGSFSAPSPLLTAAACSGCETSGPAYPWALLDPRDPGAWLLFFSGFTKIGATHLAVGRTVDQGATWNIDPVPTPGNRVQTMLGISNALAARVLWDADSALYRMWYVSLGDLVNLCSWEIFYATSSDGTLWTGTRDAVAPLTIAEVPWAGPVAAAKGGLQPGSIEAPAKAGDPYTLWFSPVAPFPTQQGSVFCAPISIGKATRN